MNNQPPILQAMPNFTNGVTFQHQHCVFMSQLENDVQAKQNFFKHYSYLKASLPYAKKKLKMIRLLCTPYSVNASNKYKIKT